ncbi:hypothetical protein QRX60_35495 [Amycolatopsis mongoliensis]|uniref:Uncharacterized protein n=1 Tax=Amycolatopsis mongoliensis TaxID=715475 RepID=A0A9Y2NC87_9PSEU|nr:hypothetical protein [Amycolatopsis sp. 4-36]WIX99326.1 hypothetical protein QRX60_35495 [Amycolatopsis sp. 4-36]
MTAIFRTFHARTPENRHELDPFDPPVLDQNSHHLDRLTANLAGG